ncbi:MAG: MFS transporter [Actinomycetota bacterium]|nr:MFS transporter [Actinomycetota bacterium]
MDQAAHVPETRPSRWLPVAGFAMVSSANQMLWLNFAPVTTGAAARLGVSGSTIGVLAEVFPVVYVLLAIPAGLALDRWFRPTLAAGAILTAAGALLRLAGHGFAPVLAGQLVVAVAQPAVLTAVTGIATRSLSTADRPTGIAVGSAGTFLGFVLAFVLGLALGAAHLHLLLVVSAAYAVAGAALLLPALGSVDAAAGVRAVGADRSALRAVWSDPVVRSVCWLVFAGFGVFVAITTWVQALLLPSGVSARGADGMLLAMVAAGILTAAALPPLVAARAKQPLVLAVAAGVSFAALVALAAAPGAAAGYAGLVLIGLVLLPVLPVLLEVLETRCGPNAGAATALLWLSGNAGGVVIALAVQAVVASDAAAFGLMAAVALGALPLARRLASRLRRPAAPPLEAAGQ